MFFYFLFSTISETIDNIWEQIKTVINQYLVKEQQSVMDTAAEAILKAQIMQIGNKESSVRQLMCKYTKNSSILIGILCN